MALTIDLDTMCYLIIKAREFDAMVASGDIDAGDNPADDDERTVLLATRDNPTDEEMRGALQALSDKERTELLALLWIGRGDFELDQWDDAVAEAIGRPEDSRPEALLDVPLLADYLEEGLSVLGFSCADVERDRL